MLFRIGLENNLERRRSAAWALEHPGCFAYGANGDAALAAMPDAIRVYAAWVSVRDDVPWVNADTVEVHVDEVWDGYTIDEHYELADDGYNVEAFFQYEWKPLTEVEVARGLKLLGWSRADLMDTIKGLDDATLHLQPPGERWSIRGIVNHIGSAEWWYLDRLELAFARAELPDEHTERLRKVRARLLETLPTLVGVEKVAGREGELWSPRKMLRRALWHERDHIDHIRGLLAAQD